MSRPTLASLDDLEPLLGEPISNRAGAEARLAQASELVRAYAGVDWLNDAGTALVDVPGAIPGVVAGIAERASRNPAGVTQESAGPYSRSFGADAAARIYLADTDKLIIRRAAASSPLQVISTTRGEMDTPTVRECDLWLDGIVEDISYLSLPPS